MISIRPLEVPPKIIPSNLVYAGGIHIQPSKPLPKVGNKTHHPDNFNN